MRTIDIDRRRLEGLRSRVLGRRTSVQVIVGALAIAAIVLAFIFRPGQTAPEAKPTSTPARPTAAAAAAPSAVASTSVPVAITAPTVVVAPTATSVPTPPKERIHTVVAGDYLSKIAEQYYGDMSKWKKIAEANKDVLPDPDKLQVGQKLKIPD